MRSSGAPSRRNLCKVARRRAAGSGTRAGRCEIPFPFCRRHARKHAISRQWRLPTLRCRQTMRLVVASARVRRTHWRVSATRHARGRECTRSRARGHYPRRHTRIQRYIDRAYAPLPERACAVDERQLQRALPSPEICRPHAGSGYGGLAGCRTSPGPAFWGRRAGRLVFRGLRYRQRRVAHPRRAGVAQW
jgi:hypothetical protein